MPTTRAELKGQMLRLLMKTPKFPGFYTEDTMNDAIQEAQDFVATEMFLANEGWQTKIMYFNTSPNQITVDIPEGVAMIQELRYKLGNTYQPLVYDDASKQVQYAEDSGAVQGGSAYRIVDNAFYFNPAMAEGGEDYLQLEYMGYPKRLESDTDFMASHFGYAFQHYMKYKAASILAASIEKFVVPWAQLEADWYRKMLDIVVMRNRQSTFVKEFC